MAYNKEELIAKALKLIPEKKIIFINELASFMHISKTTFYEYGLDEVDSIKDAIESVKNSMKKGLQAKWYNSDNATTQIALYRLISDDKEFDRLVANKTDVTTNGKDFPTSQVIVLTETQKQSYLKEIEKIEE